MWFYGSHRERGTILVLIKKSITKKYDGEKKGNFTCYSGLFVDLFIDRNLPQVHLRHIETLFLVLFTFL